MLLALHNENELLQLVTKGNERAFRELFDFYWQRIYTVAFTLTKSVVLSEEIVQDVFLKIWTKRDKLPEVKKFDGYLFMVAKNHILNELRKKTTDQTFTDNLEKHFLETSALPEQQLMLKETKQMIDKAVLQLPAQQRLVFDLSRNEGFDYNTIAEKLGISKLTVKSHMTKALQSIRHYLQTHADILFAAFIISIVLS